MQSIFIIRGVATPNLLSITSYLLLSKNPARNFGRGKSEDVRSKNPAHFRERDF